MTAIDLNCDIGEGCGNDAQLMNYVSSVNIACGFHAGDASIMRRTVERAIEKGIAIGAHPGYADRENFGRREMELSSKEVFDIVLYQISALSGFCKALGGRLNHVKPHGALYNQSAKDARLAQAIADAVAAADRNLVLFGQSGSHSITEAERIGLQTASEAFADRTYQPNGSLTPRNSPNAMIGDVDASISQVLRIVDSQTVAATNGEAVFVKADTICIHGDGPYAVEFARAVRDALIAANIKVASVGNVG